MKQNRILALSVAIALAFAITTPANAQFGNVLNKAKKAVKEKVETTVKETKKKVENTTSVAVDKTTGEVAERTGISEEVSTKNEGSYGGIKDLYKKGLKPSAAAVEADPKASVNTVERNYKKSPAQLRGVWEHLSPELFPYQPYYADVNKDYFDPDAEAPIIIYAKICRLLEEADRPFGKKGLMAEYFQYKDDTNVPIVDVLLSSYYAEFIADPESYVAYNHFNRAHIVQNAFNSNNVKMNMEDPMKFTAMMGDGTTVSLFEKEHDRIARWNEVNRIAEDLLINVTPLNTIGASADNAIRRYKQHEEKGDIQQMIITSREIQAIVNDLVNHRDYEKRKSDCSGTLREYEPIKDKYLELLQSNHEKTAPAAEMPKGVTAPANLKKIADAEAYKQWGNKFIKSIFITSKWTEFKNPKYPYEVLIRRVEVDFIVKEGNDYFVYHYVLTEGVTGGKGNGIYNISARMKQPTKEKVNYK